MSDTTTPRPGTRKVTVGALSGAIVTVALYCLDLNGSTVPPEVYAGATTMLTALLTYMTRESYS